MLTGCPACAYETRTGIKLPANSLAARRFHACRNPNATDGAHALGLLGAALAGPAALENAALNIEAFEQLDGGHTPEWYCALGDAAEIVRGGREP